MNLREALIELGKEHKRMKGGGFSDTFKFDLVNKNITSKGRCIVEHGAIIPQTITLSDGYEITIDDDWGLEPEDFYKGIESRYADYQISIPLKSEPVSNFLAKAVNELSYQEMMTGKLRAVARYELELFVIYSSVNTKIDWNNEHWFWRSEKYPRLIVYKNYL